MNLCIGRHWRFRSACPPRFWWVERGSLCRHSMGEHGSIQWGGDSQKTQNKTADRLSRHLSAVMRKIREVIGNSPASTRSLLHSVPQLAWGAELSFQTLRNYLDIHPAHPPQLRSRETIPPRRAMYAPVPVLCGLPHSLSHL